MTRLFARAYDIAAAGFYFETAEDFERLANANRNEFGQPVEEYEIQFVDGERIDCEFATAFRLNQINFAKFLELVEAWDESQKTRFIIAVGECSQTFDAEIDDIDGLEIDLYERNSLEELAEEFVDEGLFGDIPERLQNYIDMEAIARDLSVEYATTDIAGTSYVYRCG